MEPYGPVQACNGIALPFTVLHVRLPRHHHEAIHTTRLQHISSTFFLSLIRTCSFRTEQTDIQSVQNFFIVGS
jgi:hypothetical protein